MTTKTNLELLNNALLIAQNYNLKLKDNNLNYQYIQLESIYKSLFQALNDSTFKRVKKQLLNCIKTIDFAIENDLIKSSDFVYVNYTKNYINRGVLISSVLAQFENYFNLNNQKMNTHLIDGNNPASVKKQTTRENAIVVCDSGIYITKTSDLKYHYDYTTDKNKKLVKKLTELKNESVECLIEW